MTGTLDGDALAAYLVVTVSIVNASGQGKATTGMDFETVENFTLTPVDDIFDETVVIGGSARGLAAQPHAAPGVEPDEPAVALNEGNQGTLLNNWNRLDWWFCNPLAMRVLEEFT